MQKQPADTAWNYKILATFPQIHVVLIHKFKHRVASFPQRDSMGAPQYFRLKKPLLNLKANF